MEILLFGVLADIIGKSTIETTPVTDLNTLKENLISEFPSLQNYSFQFAVNQEKVESNILLSDDDEIALLPPYAGG